MAHPDADLRELMRASGITDEDVAQDYAQMLAEMEGSSSDDEQGADTPRNPPPSYADPPPPQAMRLQ